MLNSRCIANSIGKDKRSFRMRLACVSILSLLTGCMADSPGSSKLTDSMNLNTADSVEIDKSVYNTESMPNVNGKSRDYVSLNIPFSPVNTIRTNIESIHHIKLKSRGEAHITVVTPPEYAKLRLHLSDEQILQAIGNENIQSAKFKVNCLGHGTINIAEDKQSTYFLVVSSQELLNRRKNLQESFRTHGGETIDFDSSHFYPHITAGFTERDLHESDGILKDSSSCK